MASRIQVRRGTAAAWTAANPTLLAGEPGFETDTGYQKIGNGATPWVSLSYSGPSPWSRLVGISRIEGLGHSWIQGLGSKSGFFGFFDMLAASLRPASAPNWGVGGAVLSFDESVSAGNGNGGWVNIGYRLPRPKTVAPYLPMGQLYALAYGYNDIGAYEADASGLTRFQHALRYAIVRCIAAQAVTVDDASWTMAGAGWSVTPRGHSSSAGTNQPDPINFTTANGDTATIAVPADYAGEDIWLHGVQFNGSHCTWSVAVDGSTVGSLDTTLISALQAPGGFVQPGNVPWMYKIPGLAPGAHTITLTASSITSFAEVSTWSLVADSPGPIVLLLLPAQAPAGGGAGYAYPNGAANRVTNAKISALRTAMIALAAEFPNNVVTVDADTLLGNTSAYFNLNDGLGGLHVNEIGAALVAQGAWDALTSSGLVTESWLAKTAQPLSPGRVQLPYINHSITPNSSAGKWQSIPVSDGTAFTINAPTPPPNNLADGGTPYVGRKLTIEVANNTAGVLGVITWNAAFTFGGYAWTNPAAAKRRWAGFEWNGTNWICLGVAAGDY